MRFEMVGCAQPVSAQWAARVVIIDQHATADGVVVWLSLLAVVGGWQ